MAKTTTTTREYDEEGRLVKETVSEVVTADAPPYVLPGPSCTCGTSYAACPIHGGFTVTNVPPNTRPFIGTTTTRYDATCGGSTTPEAKQMLRQAVRHATSRADMLARL